MADAGIHPYHQQWAPTAAPPPPPVVAAAILNSERLKLCVEYRYCDAQADYCKSLPSTQGKSEEPCGGVGALSILSHLIRSKRLSALRYYNHYIPRPRVGTPATTKRDFAYTDLLVWPKQQV
ncbi:hypothetical protein ACLB2K_022761 [Fragaria x ananassa]